MTVREHWLTLLDHLLEARAGDRHLLDAERIRALAEHVDDLQVGGPGDVGDVLVRPADEGAVEGPLIGGKILQLDHLFSESIPSFHAIGFGAIGEVTDPTDAQVSDASRGGKNDRGVRPASQGWGELC